jgi:hypothetical protein
LADEAINVEEGGSKIAHEETGEVKHLWLKQNSFLGVNELMIPLNTAAHSVSVAKSEMWQP